MSFSPVGRDLEIATSFRSHQRTRFDRFSPVGRDLEIATARLEEPAVTSF